MNRVVRKKESVFVFLFFLFFFLLFTLFCILFLFHDIILVEHIKNLSFRLKERLLIHKLLKQCLLNALHQFYIVMQGGIISWATEKCAELHSE